MQPLVLLAVRHFNSRSSLVFKASILSLFLQIHSLVSANTSSLKANPQLYISLVISKSSRNRIPCDFVCQYLVSQARLSREGARILNCFPLTMCNSLKTADRRTCSEDLATGTWLSKPPASRQAVRMTQSSIPYQSEAPNHSGIFT